MRLRAGVRSAPVGTRPYPAPSYRAPPPVPGHPCGPVPLIASVGSAPPRARIFWFARQGGMEGCRERAPRNYFLFESLQRLKV